MEMLQATGYKKCIPHATSIDAAFRVYQDIPGFIDRARQSGVVAIYLKNPKRKG
jgi:ASC-1-like (ASCH) protein